MRAQGLALGALLVALAGCANAPPSDDLAPLRLLAESRLGTQLPATAGDAEFPAGQLDLGVALRTAFARNPELQETLLQIGVARAEFAAASALPNPVLGLAARLPNRAPSAANIEFDVLGNLLDLLLRPQRMAGGKMALEETVLEASSALLGLAADVESAYLAAVADDAKLRTLRGLLRQAREDRDATAGLRTDGVVSAGALLRADAVVAQHQLELLQAKQARAGSRARLARLLGLTGEEIAALRLPKHLPRLPDKAPVVLGPEKLAVTTRPEIDAARKAIERRALSRQIALDWRWLPSLQAGLAGERPSEGGLALGPRIEIDLPVFEHGEPRLARLGAELQIAQQRLAGRMLDVQTEARLAAYTLAKRHAAAHLHEQTLLPLRRRALEVARALRQLGAAGVDELGLARQEYLRAAVARQDALRDYWLAEAALRRALGGTLVETRASP